MILLLLLLLLLRSPTQSLQAEILSTVSMVGMASSHFKRGHEGDRNYYYYSAASLKASASFIATYVSARVLSICLSVTVLHLAKANGQNKNEMPFGRDIVWSQVTLC